MIERKIKELAIALEAVSRVNAYAAVIHGEDISDLLKAAIKEAKEAKEQQIKDSHPLHIYTPNDDVPY